MSIFSALRKYGFENFELYILEIIPNDQKNTLTECELHWVKEVNPSYNIAAITSGVIGENHPLYGKKISPEIIAKRSAARMGVPLTEDHKRNISLAKSTITVYCYDFNTGTYITQFVGLRNMARQLGLAGHTQIRLSYCVRQQSSKLDNGKPFPCTYNGIKTIWLITTRPNNTL